MRLNFNFLPIIYDKIYGAAPRKKATFMRALYPPRGRILQTRHCCAAQLLPPYCNAARAVARAAYICQKIYIPGC